MLPENQHACMCSFLCLNYSHELMVSSGKKIPQEHIKRLKCVNKLSTSNYSHTKQIKIEYELLWYIQETKYLKSTLHSTCHFKLHKAIEKSLFNTLLIYKTY